MLARAGEDLVRPLPPARAAALRRPAPARGRDDLRPPDLLRLREPHRRGSSPLPRLPPQQRHGLRLVNLTARQAKDLRASRPPARSEAEVQRAILDYLRTVPGVYAFRCNSRVVRMPGAGGRERLVRFGVKGLPDILAWRSRVFPGALHLGPIAQWLAVEVKRSGAKPRPEQVAFLDLLRRAGGIAVVASSVEDVVSALA